jgi:hypothetical protein
MFGGLMENVVYILGAGFSAPLGIPLLSNFLSKSKDIFSKNTEQYIEFEKIYKNIEKITAIKNYYNSDLLNIEEILSILEMQKYSNLTDMDLTVFKRFISDVVKGYTPVIEKCPEKWPGNYYDVLFGKKYHSYGNFVANLLNLEFEQYSPPSNEIRYAFNKNSEYSYSIITLNYDEIIENLIGHIIKSFSNSPKIEIATQNILVHDGISIAKLHGTCSFPESIISPTWNKSSNNAANNVWELAGKLLNKANHIRILGYSLPESDSYIKYLLKVSAIGANNLKSIDVICYDKDDSVKERYSNFVTFRDLKFVNEKIEKYINPHSIL